MNNDSINFKNKIISYNDLLDIFSKMYLDLENYKKINKSEELKNRILEYNYQKWTFKDGGSNLSFEVEFYNDTTIKYDNYNNFITAFNNRLDEIKNIYVFYHLNYSMTNYDGKLDSYYSTIRMYIYENSVKLEINSDSNDNKLEEVCDLIRKKTENAKNKYDDIIINKSSIVFKIGIAIGFIPSIIISILLLLNSSIRSIFSESIVLYPICCFFMTILFGNIIGSNKMDNLYKNIVPDKKYINYQKGYKDDINKYVVLVKF